MNEQQAVVVIGGGQAGLSVSHELAKASIEHVVLERARVGETWRRRWESFCLVTPNWTVQLPDFAYDGHEPDGFMVRDEIVDYLERYAANFQAPLREGVDVSSLYRENSLYLLQTSQGPIRARTVIVCTGAYQKPHRPAGAKTLPADILQIDVDSYWNSEALPAGKVLIVGSGQSGCQIAEELQEAGREVFLSCGRAPWAPRRVGDHDIVWWAIESGFMDQTRSALPTPAARLGANILATGHGGGHDLHLRTLRRAGVTLLGHFLGADGYRATFAPDLGDSLTWGDERYSQLMDMIRKLVRERGLPMPPIAEPEPFDAKAPEQVDLRGFGAVIFAGGFRPDLSSWIQVPGAFDDLGFPVETGGRSNATGGLYFVGVHFLRKRKSSLLYGVGEDAAIVAQQIADTHQVNK